MKRLAGRYAIIQFIPYPETGEFANIGVVLVCPKTGYFGFKLQTKRYARYTNFFRDLEGKVYLRAVNAFKLELERVKTIVGKTATENNVREAFQLLLHPRDALIQFGGERACLLAAPAENLEKLYQHYVEHDFVTPEYIEKKLERRIQKLVEGLGLKNPFKNEVLGKEDFTVNFPLVQKINDKPVRVIKPFYLGQAETNQIYDHGDRWLMMLRRLRDRKQLPNEILFTVEGPEVVGNINPDLRLKAFEEVCETLNEVAKVTKKIDEQAIIGFATGY
jgi:hypothetical protein